MKIKKEKLGAKLVAGVALAAAIITIYQFFLPKDFSNTVNSTINEDNIVQADGVVNMGSGTINQIGISLQEHEESLKRREEEIRESLTESIKEDIFQNSKRVTVNQQEVEKGVIEIPAGQHSNITLKNNQLIELRSVQANISVMFSSFSGKKFVKLTIAPVGKKPVSLPIYNQGQYLEFESKTGTHTATVLSVDFRRKNVMVGVSKVN